MTRRLEQRPLVIGVTGHRVLADAARVRSGVRVALRRIAHTFPARPWAIVSPLAEGADRMVAEHALRRRHTKLVVPLPLPSDEYLRDFEDADSRAHFQALLRKADQIVRFPKSRSRARAYQAVGDYVVDHYDVIVAVLDGRSGQGRGGTSSIVRRARRRGLPLAWVRAGNRRPGTAEPTTLGGAQGAVTFERFE